MQYCAQFIKLRHTYQFCLINSSNSIFNVLSVALLVSEDYLNRLNPSICPTDKIHKERGRQYRWSGDYTISLDCLLLTELFVYS